MIKKPFRMSKPDLKARSIYHHERELHRSSPDRRRRGVSRWIEQARTAAGLALFPAR
jgi:hypothetical protein